MKPALPERPPTAGVPLDAGTLACVAPVFAALGEVRFVGGCVRDALLGLVPDDIDLATPLTPDVVSARLRAAGISVQATGIAHGTVTAITGDASNRRRRVEITTLRRDVACFGRHAQVVFTDDWTIDAARRDFTINALSCTADGRLYDPFGGLDDLRRGCVRFIGEPVVRIREDVLRLLRYFRFYGRYGHAPPDLEALAACRALAPLLADLSGERVRAEVFGLLGHSRCAEVWTLLCKTAVLPHLLPGADRIARLAAILAQESILGLSARDRALQHLAALLPSEEVVVEAVSERLRLAREERARLRALAVPAVVLSPTAAPRDIRRALLKVRDTAVFRDLLMLAATEDGESVGDINVGLAVAARWMERRFPFTGRDVLALGIPPGPAIGQMLAELELWWADHDFAPSHQEVRAEAANRLADLPKKTFQ